MSRLKCSYREIVAILEGNGFVLHRHDGTSHRHYRRMTGGKVFIVTVSYHGISDDCPIGTLKSIIRDSGLSQRLFRK